MGQDVYKYCITGCHSNSWSSLLTDEFLVPSTGSHYPDLPTD